MLQCAACGECFKDIYALASHRRTGHGVNYTQASREEIVEGEGWESTSYG